MATKGVFGGFGIAGDEEIVDVVVEEVGDVEGARVEHSPAATARHWHFPDDFFDTADFANDIATVEVQRELAPPPRAAATAAHVNTTASAAMPGKHLKPPANHAETVLRILIAVALATLLGFGVYLFSIAAPERYAAFRAYLPESWTFLPRPATPNETNLSDQD